MIGGDLTGVSKRKKYGVFSRYGEISIFNWIAVAIVVMILAAFFWPQADEPIREVVEKNATVNSSSIYTESRIDEIPEDAIPAQTFSRQNDADRALAFREAEATESKTQELLNSAEAFIAKGAYTQPVGSNAVIAYKSVLEIDPTNNAAKQGLDYINNRYLSAGYEALKKDNINLAQSSLGKLAAVSDTSEEYVNLTEAIKRWKLSDQVDDFMVKAKKAQAADNLILPASENALFYYQQILALDESNKSALKGVQNITDTYIDRANSALIQGRYEAATGYLATVSVIDPANTAIPLIEAMIAKAEPLAKQSTLAQQATSTTKNSANPSSEPASPSVGDGKPANNSSRPDRRDNPATVRTTPPTAISSEKTPNQEASEQAAFDRQYLARGLDAYYKGDYETAASLLQPLADKGVSRAQFRIGYMYYLGRGFPRNRKEADRIIRAALPSIQKFAKEGRTWAQSDLGSLYEDGLVLPRNFGEAVYWYRSAAEKGYPGAQTNLGIMYARGRGVTSSRRTAIEWFQRAAKQGDVVAKRNLEALGVN